MASRKSKNKLKTKRRKRKLKKVSSGKNYNRQSCRGEYEGLKYESALELATILHCRNIGLSVERPDINPPLRYLSVKDQKIHRYYPDFVIGGIIYCEVKGFFSRKEYSNIFLKHQALEDWCRKNGYWAMMLTEDMLSPVWLTLAKKIHNSTPKKKK